MKPASAASLLHLGVAEIAARHPDRIAVREGERELDYRALVQRASDLASGLYARGVRPDDRVAIHLDKSTEAVVAILGVLMAGACYVPIDVRSPARRVATILADCGVRLAIGTAARTAKAFAHLPPGASVATLVALDVAEPQPASSPGTGLGIGPVTGPGIGIAPWPAASAPGVALPAIELDPETPAYILYTSGSTGTPKGVVLSHRAAMAFVAWASATFPVGPDDRVISQAPFHFDLSVFDLFVTLRAGATLVLPPAGITISPSGYVRFLHDEGITVFYATPAILSSLVRDGHLDRHDRWRLRTVLFAGDVMPPRTLGDLMRAIPAARFANLYGPTETNVCTWHEIATAPVDDTPIPIGRACAGLELRIDGEEGSVASSGELWVTGPSLMSGYWNRPKDSAARLVADRAVPGRTWYRTGDRVDRDATGLLHFRGRIDSMVKIRGHRVEPEEVEHVLRKHPAVREAVVVPVSGPSGETSLAAVVSTYDAPPAPRDLQRLCAEHLPEPMIPTAFTFTDHLPMTSTGKVDRKRVQTDLGRETMP